MAKILIHSLIFSPDGVSTAYLYSDIARRLHDEGHEVVVLSTTPHYNIVDEELAKQPMRWKIPGICKQSDYHGIKVYHIPQKKFKSTLLRLFGFAYWHVIAFIIGLSIRKVDLILSPSPPLTIGVINNWLKKLKGCRTVYNVQEIYPDILPKKEGTVVNMLKKMERYVYNKSNAVTTIDRVFYDTIVERFKDPSKLHIIPNFVDTELYNPGNCDTSVLDRTMFPRTDAIKVMYAGNIGFAQDWETLVDLAKRTREENIEYFVIGEGVMKPWLEEQKKAEGLDKIHILPYQKRELMPVLLAYSDVQFIFMSPQMEGQGFPSKVYTIMACARPLMVCSGAGTPIVNFLEGKGCALLDTEKDQAAKVEKLYEWLRNQTKQTLRETGVRGFDVIEKEYSKEIVTGQYLELVENLCKKGK